MTKTFSPAPSLASDQTRIRRIALSVLFLGAMGIAFSPIFVRLSDLGPTATGFHRVFLAVPLLWAWAMTEGRRHDAPARPGTRRDFLWLIMAGVFFAGDLLFWHWSITFTSVANSTLLANAAPIFVTLGSFLLFGERFSKLFLFGLTLGIAGAAILMADSLTVSAETLLGDAFGLVTAIFYAAYIVTVGRLRATFSTAVIMTWSSASAAVILLPAALISGEGLMAETLMGWLVLIGLAWISHTGGQSLIAYALAHLPAAFSSVSLLVQPIASSVLAWIILGEALGPWQAVGAGVILSGIFLARRGSV